MELMQLEMFVAVVEESSVRRAAERVYRTQPAVSIALGKLQEEIGTLLLEDDRRTNRRLTKAGEILYEYASRILGMRNEALSLLRGEGRRCVGSVFIGVDSEENQKLVRQLNAAVSREHPGLRVVTRRGRREKLLLDLRERKLDFALLSTDQENQEAGPDLVVSAMGGIARERSRWIIQRRAYQSEAVKVFGGLLAAASRSPATPQQTSRLKKEPLCFRPVAVNAERIENERCG